MDNVILPAAVRDSSVKSNDLRRDRKLPAVVYGHGIDPKSVTLEYEPTRKAFMKAGETSIVELDVDGKKVPVLFKQIQFHPVSEKIQHVDFYAVNMKEDTTANVPVEFVGTSPAVKDEGGTLTPQLTEVEVKCLPNRIPHAFEVDITPLIDFHSAIHVSDLVAPSDVEIITDPELTIVTVSAPRKAEEVELSPAEEEAAAIAEAAGEEEGEGGEDKTDSE